MSSTNVIDLKVKINERHLHEFEELLDELYNLEIKIEDIYFDRWRCLLDLLAMFIANSDLPIELNYSKETYEELEQGDYESDVERMKYMLWLMDFIVQKKEQLA